MQRKLSAANNDTMLLNVQAFVFSLIELHWLFPYGITGVMKPLVDLITRIILRFFLISYRLADLNSKQEKERVEKVESWEIWLTRIKELMVKCQGKEMELKARGEPQKKKEIDEQLNLANVSALIRYIILYFSIYIYIIF